MFQIIKKSLRKFYRKVFYHTPPETIQTQKKKLPYKQVSLIKGGDLNKDKIFYVKLSKAMESCLS